MLSSYLLRSQMAHPMPDAMAILKGSSKFPDIYGTVRFSPVEDGVMIEVYVSGLPAAPANYPDFFAFHLHETGDCSDDFTDTGMHYNPYQTSHPHHAGDFPPLLNNKGAAWMVFYDSYLTIDDVVGRSVIIHRNRDNFTSQPSGDSGDKIACGVVSKL